MAMNFPFMKIRIASHSISNPFKSIFSGPMEFCALFGYFAILYNYFFVRFLCSFVSIFFVCVLYWSWLQQNARLWQKLNCWNECCNCFVDKLQQQQPQQQRISILAHFHTTYFTFHFKKLNWIELKWIEIKLLTCIALTAYDWLHLFESREQCLLNKDFINDLIEYNNIVQFSTTID